ncbi:(2Fe-2S)-binding protein [Brasilonema octagenarum UFV-E1]|uniref:(2Fe-2S)-binding protein n=2 Tax=Brasilonema TaxID=383614 RepID=A0A856MK04_9CYAN|nr:MULTISPECIES: 2Fe-2S iron-sulfur cluster-binding protein [Brasilonema]NMF64016.1 (2Fe-2S)-binding protein [Brasilonema octagenarum UFV-OR1]QDL09276.1 (2Fe-2S)-binding protein [Brasilonema sennae CENA114]QDL15633.1 (2Fe-2S)-binding protein [Brasilonema octagenarum UFV-E1]
MRLRLKRRLFGQFAIATTFGTMVESLKAKTLAQSKPQSRPPSAISPDPSSFVDIKLRVNGTEHALKIEPRVTLLDVLRERLNLTGSKKGCDHGQCGACTVLVDGRRVNSCLTFAIMHTDAKITTIEGLAQGENLHPMQAAFIARDAFQCGYCTPGQICSAVGLVNEKHAKSDADIRELMSGNICRCGAYPNIVNAVRDVLEGKKDAAV